MRFKKLAKKKDMSMSSLLLEQIETMVNRDLEESRCRDKLNTRIAKMENSIPTLKSKMQERRDTKKTWWGHKKK